jgi:hypothetical protein
MKRIALTKMTKSAGIVALCALTCSLASAALAYGKQDFTLHNETGKTVQELYVSPHDTDEWEEDVLGDEVLEDGEQADITFDRGENAASWDMKVVFNDGKNSVWTKLKLKELTDITISYKNGKPWATWKNGD